MTAINHVPEQAEISDTKPHPGRRMTEQEFVDWCDDTTHAEWVDGEVIIMSAVQLAHAILFDFLHRLVGDFVEFYRLGTVVTEPYHVRLADQRRRRSPDILFVSAARQDVLKNQHVEGAPDLILEIVSPESKRRD